jgi:hypothetical protein
MLSIPPATVSSVLIGNTWHKARHFRYVDLSIDGKKVAGFEIGNDGEYIYGAASLLGGFKTGRRILSEQEQQVRREGEIAQELDTYVLQHRTTPDKGDPLFAKQQGKCLRCSASLAEHPGWALSLRSDEILCWTCRNFETQALR